MQTFSRISERPSAARAAGESRAHSRNMLAREAARHELG